MARRGKKVAKIGERPKAELPYYKPHKMTEEEWEAAGGVICPVCRKETTRLIPYGFTRKRKACPKCVERRVKLLDTKARILAVRHGPRRGSATRARMLMIKYFAKHPEVG